MVVLCCSCLLSLFSIILVIPAPLLKANIEIEVILNVFREKLRAMLCRTEVMGQWELLKMLKDPQIIE